MGGVACIAVGSIADLWRLSSARYKSTSDVSWLFQAAFRESWLQGAK